ncbi:hypothetical protein TNCV_4118891 [Trichonephila clavipes]|nr:hypothetical protein TNCV_4118891 [Trichonephila clavipes]
MTPCGKSCHSLCICAVNSPVSRKVAFPACPDMLYWRKDLVTWQAMVGRHITLLGDFAVCNPVDKWHLGDLIAWVAQSALKYTYLRAVKVP